MEKSLRNEESSKLNMRWLSPLVGDHNRVGGNMIVMVDIIAGQPTRAPLTKQGCQLVTLIEMPVNKDLPSGNTGFHLEIQLRGSNEHPKKTAAYR